MSNGIIEMLSSKDRDDHALALAILNSGNIDATEMMNLYEVISRNGLAGKSYFNPDETDLINSLKYIMYWGESNKVKLSN